MSGNPNVVKKVGLHGGKLPSSKVNVKVSVVSSRAMYHDMKIGHAAQDMLSMNDKLDKNHRELTDALSANDMQFKGNVEQALGQASRAIEDAREAAGRAFHAAAAAMASTEGAIAILEATVTSSFDNMDGRSHNTQTGWTNQIEAASGAVQALQQGQQTGRDQLAQAPQLHGHQINVLEQKIEELKKRLEDEGKK